MKSVALHHMEKNTCAAFNNRLKGILSYREGIEYLPEDDPLSTSDEEDMSEISDSELDFQE